MKNYFKGISFGIGSVILIGIQPIIANSRPSEIDAFFFAMMTVIYEAIIFFPLFLIERKQLKVNNKAKFNQNDESNILSNGWKKHKKLLIYLGVNFAIAQILFYISFELAGAINASLAQKTTIIFGLFFGFLINHEKITITQLIFSVILLFGLVLAVTQGSFSLLEFNIGVLVMIATTCLWMIAHSFTKPILEKNELSSIQVVFIRNLLNGIVLVSTFFIFFPTEKITILFSPLNHIFFILMGITYSFDLYCWYKALAYIDVSTASIIIAPSPIITTLFAMIILDEIFTIYHLIGTIIITTSIIVIVKKKVK